MEHKQINQGWEHYVYECKYKNLILKKPRITTQLLLFLISSSPESVRQKHQEVENLVKNTAIKVPSWRVFSLNQFKSNPIFKNGYITAQQRINYDYSVQNIPEVLKQGGLLELLYRYYVNPDNFLTQEGTIYYIDPTETISPANFLESKGIISKNRYRRMRYLLIQDIHKITNLLK